MFLVESSVMVLCMCYKCFVCFLIVLSLENYKENNVNEIFIVSF